MENNLNPEMGSPIPQGENNNSEEEKPSMEQVQHEQEQQEDVPKEEQVSVPTETPVTNEEEKPMQESPPEPEQKVELEESSSQEGTAPEAGQPEDGNKPGGVAWKKIGVIGLMIAVVGLLSYFATTQLFTGSVFDIDPSKITYTPAQAEEFFLSDQNEFTVINISNEDKKASHFGAFLVDNTMELLDGAYAGGNITKWFNEKLAGNDLITNRSGLLNEVQTDEGIKAEDYPEGVNPELHALYNHLWNNLDFKAVAAKKYDDDSLPVIVMKSNKAKIAKVMEAIDAQTQIYNKASVLQSNLVALRTDGEDTSYRGDTDPDSTEGDNRNTTPDPTSEDDNFRAEPSDASPYTGNPVGAQDAGVGLGKLGGITGLGTGAGTSGINPVGVPEDELSKAKAATTIPENSAVQQLEALKAKAATTIPENSAVQQLEALNVKVTATSPEEKVLNTSSENPDTIYYIMTPAVNSTNRDAALKDDKIAMALNWELPKELTDVTGTNYVDVQFAKDSGDYTNTTKANIEKIKSEEKYEVSSSEMKTVAQVYKLANDTLVHFRVAAYKDGKEKIYYSNEKTLKLKAIPLETKYVFLDEKTFSIKDGEEKDITPEAILNNKKDAPELMYGDKKDSKSFEGNWVLSPYIQETDWKYETYFSNNEDFTDEAESNQYKEVDKSIEENSSSLEYRSTSINEKLAKLNLKDGDTLYFKLMGTSEHANTVVSSPVMVFKIKGSTEFELVPIFTDGAGVDITSFVGAAEEMIKTVLYTTGNHPDAEKTALKIKWNELPSADKVEYQIVVGNNKEMQSNETEKTVTVYFPDEGSSTEKTFSYENIKSAMDYLDVKEGEKLYFVVTATVNEKVYRSKVAVLKTKELKEKAPVSDFKINKAYTCSNNAEDTNVYVEFSQNVDKESAGKLSQYQINAEFPEEVTTEKNLVTIQPASEITGESELKVVQVIYNEDKSGEIFNVSTLIGEEECEIVEPQNETTKFEIYPIDANGNKLLNGATVVYDEPGSKLSFKYDLGETPTNKMSKVTMKFAPTNYEKLSDWSDAKKTIEQTMSYEGKTGEMTIENLLVLKTALSQITTLESGRVYFKMLVDNEESQVIGESNIVVLQLLESKNTNSDFTFAVYDSKDNKIEDGSEVKFKTKGDDVRLQLKAVTPDKIDTSKEVNMTVKIFTDNQDAMYSFAAGKAAIDSKTGEAILRLSDAEIYTSLQSLIDDNKIKAGEAVNMVVYLNNEGESQEYTSNNYVTLKLVVEGAIDEPTDEPTEGSDEDKIHVRMSCLKGIEERADQFCVVQYSDYLLLGHPDQIKKMIEFVNEGKGISRNNLNNNLEYQKIKNEMSGKSTWFAHYAETAVDKILEYIPANLGAIKFMFKGYMLSNGTFRLKASLPMSKALDAAVKPMASDSIWNAFNKQFKEMGIVDKIINFLNEYTFIKIEESSVEDNKEFLNALLMTEEYVTENNEEDATEAVDDLLKPLPEEQPILDQWDPTDDTVAGATVIVPSAEEKNHGPHTLSKDDLIDHFKVDFKAGNEYSFVVNENDNASNIINIEDINGKTTDDKFKLKSENSIGLSILGPNKTGDECTVVVTTAYVDDSAPLAITHTPEQDITLCLAVETLPETGGNANYDLSYQITKEPEAQPDAFNVKVFNKDGQEVGPSNKGISYDPTNSTSTDMKVEWALPTEITNQGSLVNEVYAYPSSDLKDEEKILLDTRNYSDLSVDAPAGGVVTVEFTGAQIKEKLNNKTYFISGYIKHEDTEYISENAVEIELQAASKPVEPTPDNGGGGSGGGGGGGGVPHGSGSGGVKFSTGNGGSLGTGQTVISTQIFNVDLACIEASTLPTVFQDVHNTHWAYDGITFLASMASRATEKANYEPMTIGYPLNADFSELRVFKPNNEITRAEFLKLTQEANCQYEIKGPVKSDFPDIVGHWAQGLIIQAASNGVVSGYTDGTFGPNNPVTRAQALKILLEIKGTDLIAYNPTAFTDVHAEDWYSQYVSTAKAEGLLKGIPSFAGGNFEPNKPITRAETAMLTYNMYNYILNIQNQVIVPVAAPEKVAKKKVKVVKP